MKAEAPAATNLCLQLGASGFVTQFLDSRLCHVLCFFGTTYQRIWKCSDSHWEFDIINPVSPAGKMRHSEFKPLVPQLGALLAPRASLLLPSFYRHLRCFPPSSQLHGWTTHQLSLPTLGFSLGMAREDRPQHWAVG